MAEGQDALPQASASAVAACERYASSAAELLRVVDDSVRRAETEDTSALAGELRAATGRLLRSIAGAEPQFRLDVTQVSGVANALARELEQGRATGEIRRLADAVKSADRAVRRRC